MNKDKETDVKSPPPAPELATSSPSSVRSPAVSREPNAGGAEDTSMPHRHSGPDLGHKKRGRKRKPALETVDPEEAKRIHNLNNKKLRDDQNELFAQLKRMVGIEPQAKKTTVLLRVVEHMQKQEEVIALLKRRIQELEHQPLRASSSIDTRPPGEHMDTGESSARESDIEYLAGAQKVLQTMESTHADIKSLTNQLHHKAAPRLAPRFLKDEKNSPTSLKPEMPRRLSTSEKKPLGSPAPPHSKLGTACEDAAMDDERKSSADLLVSLALPSVKAAVHVAPGLPPLPPHATAPLAAGSYASTAVSCGAVPSVRAAPPTASLLPAVAVPISIPAPVPVPAAAAATTPIVSPPPVPQLPPAAAPPEPDWLGSADLRLFFWRHGKALRHQPGRPAPSSDKIASRLYKLPRALFDCRQSGRDVKHEENGLSSCAAPSCCRPMEDNNWTPLVCGDRIHKECFDPAHPSCYASRSVFFAPPPSVQLWRVGDAVSLAPPTAADKLLGAISCFAKNDGPALAVPFSVLGPLKEHITSLERILSHVEVRRGVFKGDTVVETEGDEADREETVSTTPTTTRAHSTTPAAPAAHSGEHLYPLIHHLTAVSSGSVLHLCFKQHTSIRHRSHKRDTVEVTRVFRLRFNPPEGPPLLSTWFLLAAPSWAGLAEKGAKMLPGDQSMGPQLLEALLESGGAD